MIDYLKKKNTRKKDTQRLTQAVNSSKIYMAITVNAIYYTGF